MGTVKANMYQVHIPVQFCQFHEKGIKITGNVQRWASEIFTSMQNKG